MAAASTVTYPLCSNPKSEAAKAAYLSLSSIMVIFEFWGRSPIFPFISAASF